MPLYPTVTDIALRLFLTLVAGAVIGIDRSERGHAAGLRTTMLVCLAASVSMIQMNLLLPVSGKGTDFFSVMDVMRLPLGILSGIGFIGAGAILRKGDVVSGVTTAATLWLVTVIGLCLGGGQLWLGVVGTGLGWLILYALKGIDARIKREHKAVLALHTTLEADLQPQLGAILTRAEIRSSFVGARYNRSAGTAELRYKIRWKAPVDADEPRETLHALLDLPDVRHLSWKGVA